MDGATSFMRMRDHDGGGWVRGDVQRRSELRGQTPVGADTIHSL
uniref:Uncharacterized protein n=1 Tax=Cucumis melo TaxID=3656 RepID=A0A9I9EB12_CUCME